MPAKRWTQKVGRASVRKETAQHRAWRKEGAEGSKELYDEQRAKGATVRKRDDGKWVWASGEYRGITVSHLNRLTHGEPPVRIRSGKDRKQMLGGLRRRLNDSAEPRKGWTLRAANVGRDKRTGRFKSR